MREIKFLTEDKVEIAVNHYKNGFDSVIIIAPGWFMTKDSRSFKQMSDIFSKKSDVMAMDFRGHGNSSGFYTFTSKELEDIAVVLDFARTNYKKIYVIGFSLGAAIALISGSHFDYIDKIIAVSAPTDFGKIENRIWKKEAWLPTFQKCELKRWFSIRPGFITGKKIKPVEIVNKIKCPTLFIAGEKDPTVFYWHTKTLYDKAVCKKEYKLFKNCYHAEDLFLQDGDNFIESCERWLFSE